MLYIACISVVITVGTRTPIFFCGGLMPTHPSHHPFFISTCEVLNFIFIVFSLLPRTLHAYCYVLMIYIKFYILSSKIPFFPSFAMTRRRGNTWKVTCLLALECFFFILSVRLLHIASFNTKQGCQ